MSTTFTLDTATSRAHPVPEPVRRLTVPAILARKQKGGEPVVMLTAYTARMAQLLDPHCDMLLVGDSLGQVIYGLDTTVRVTLDMMIAHGAAVVRGSYRCVVVVGCRCVGSHATCLSRPGPGCPLIAKWHLFRLHVAKESGNMNMNRLAT